MPSESKNWPDSINFLQLSQAPPELDIDIANYTPLTSDPIKSPTTNIGWKIIPKNKGVIITIRPGRIISLKEAIVETHIQAS